MRLRAALIVAILAAGLVASPAEARKPRRAMRPYTWEDVNHHFGVYPVGAGVWEQEDAYDFPLRKGENEVSVMVLDDGEGPVAGAVVQWTMDFEAGGASAGHALVWHEFCTETEEPVPVYPDVTVQIIIQKGTCADGSPSLPTTGDIVVDFFKTESPPPV